MSEHNLTKQVKSYILLKDKVDCYPETYVLPDELDLFEQNKHNHELWILKEDMIDRGKSHFFG